MIKIKPFPYLLGSLRICLRASSPVRSGAQERSGELARRLNSESWYYSNFPKSDFSLFHSGVLSSSSPVVFFELFDVFQNHWWLWKYKSNRPSNIFPDWNNNFYMGWVLERARWSKSCVLIGYKISLPCSLGISPALSHKKRFGSCHTGNTSFIGQEG